MKYSPKHIAEYVALRSVAAIFHVLPYRVALGVGWVLARLAFLVARRRVKTAESRIREVFGDRYTDREVRRIAWISLRNLFFNGVESMLAGRFTREQVERMTIQEQTSPIFEHAKSGKGCILVVAHMGNWEFAGLAAHLMGLPLFIIVARQSNPLTDAYLNRMRAVTGIELIWRDTSALKKAVRNIRDGKVMTFMTDMRSRTPGVTVHFLGKPANVAGGLGVFARMANVPVFAAVTTRVGWTRHRWRLQEAIVPDLNADRDADSLRMTQHVLSIFEKAVREEPEQYFWYNKRWVLDPLVTSSTSAHSPHP